VREEEGGNERGDGKGMEREGKKRGEERGGASPPKYFGLEPPLFIANL